MKLPFGRSGEVRCRHCGSPDVRVSTRSSSSSDHVTYRCHTCRRHFRVRNTGTTRQSLLAAAAFIALTLVSVGMFLYLATDDGDRDVGALSYQPTVDVDDPAKLEKTRQAAQTGSAQAQFDLGWAYWQRGDYLQALPWIKAAAGQQHAEAQYTLAMAYFEGHGTVQNFHEAQAQFSNAAQRAHLEAQYRLGLFYRDGLAGPPDKEKAYLWLNVAAARGHQDALHYRDKLAAAMSSEEIHRAQEASTRAMAQFGATAPRQP